MNRRSWMVAVILVLLVAAVVLLLFRNGREKPSPSNLAEPAQTSVPSAVEPEAPAASTAVARSEKTGAELPVPDAPPDAVRPLRDPDAKVQSDAEAVRFLTAMKEKWGWNNMKTLKCIINVTAEDTYYPGKPRISTMKVDMAAEFPDKLSWMVEADLGGNKMKMYVVSDGSFFQCGTIAPDGATTPMDAKEVNPRDQGFTWFNGDLYNPDVFRYDKPVNVTVDPEDPSFRKDDGSPPDSLDFVMLKMDRDSEIYVDPSSMQVKAIKWFDDGKLVMYSRVTFQEISPGIWYPSRVDTVSTMATMEAVESKHEMHMKMDASDFEVNSAVDPSVFSFAARPSK